ncbi:dUTP diphosphatase [Brevibacillus laterosporus]|uniref:dUTP diphosphatase n=1 Tax=Brevibacillus laterosporus TaxID=1465 RepID=UPI002E24C8A1|nr:dUTP diphosphatase [Brevibacillus laterosporus]
MEISLETLFEKQKQLDDYIIKKKGLEGQDLFSNKILALQVELGELANEWRGFKHWSEDREPRSRVKVHCELCGPEDNPKYTREDAGRCPNCCTGVISFKNPLLEEYVDCLHFILSIGIEKAYKLTSIVPHKAKTGGVLQQFLSLNKHVGNMNFAYKVDEAGNFRTTNFYDKYDTSFRLLLGLGEMLGFTWDEITGAYDKKWQINIQRQESEY